MSANPNPSVIGLPRRCGHRIPGGVYVETPLASKGLPLESFLIDPPVPVVPSDYGLSAQGMTLITDPRRPDVYHLMDWVGSDNYPKPADFFEEVRHLGLSRRVPVTFDFSKIGPYSRIILVHKKAYFGNYDEWYDAMSGKPDGWPIPEWYCRKAIPAHQDPNVRATEMCVTLHWADGEVGEGDLGGLVYMGLPTVTISHPSGYKYQTAERPYTIAPEYKIAMWLSLPIGNLAVVKDTLGGTHTNAYHQANASGIKVNLVDV